MNTKYIISPYYHSSLEKESSEIIVSDNPNININNFIISYIFRFINRFDDPYGSKFYIYRLKNTFERGYLVRNAIVLPNDRDVLNTLTNESVDGLKNNVYFSSADGLDIKNNNNPTDLDENGELEITYYGPDKIVFVGKTTSPKYLVISNSYHPYWEAKINNIKTLIYRANHAFQAIYIEKSGNFKVVFEFKDKYHYIKTIAVIIGFIILIYGIIIKFNIRIYNK